MKSYREVSCANLEDLHHYKAKIGFNRFSGEEFVKVCADDGSELYLSYGSIHRVDGPAVRTTSGSLEWWKEGRRMSKDEFLSSLSIDEMSNFLSNRGNF